MRRRSFITLAAGAAAWPLATRAQSPKLPVVGFLNVASAGAFTPFSAAFREGLKQAGYVAGQNVEIEYRWAEGHYDQLAALAADLVRRNVAVILASGGSVSVQAAQRATTTLPIVFITGGDPVKDGFVATMSRPGGNTTGVAVLTTGLMPKRLEFIRALVPGLTLAAALINPNNPNRDLIAAELTAAAQVADVRLGLFYAASEPEFDTAFSQMAQAQASALLVAADAFFNSRRTRLVELTARYRIPAVYEWREYAEAGGLMSYGTNLAAGYRQAGIYVGRILKGEKPGDLPVQQSTEVELVINLKTAKALGLTVPLPLLGRADEVIE